MKKILIGCGAVAVVIAVVCCFTDWGKIRGQVAVDSTLEGIDNMLGKIKVKRATISKTLDDIKKMQNDMLRSQAHCEARADLLGKKVEAHEKFKQQTDLTLAKLRAKLNDTALVTVSISGKEYSKQDVQKAAEKLIARRGTTISSIVTLKESQSLILKMAADLGDKLTASETKVASLKSLLAEIDTKEIAMKALKTSHVAGEDNSMADKLTKLETDIEDLLVDVNTDLTVEQKKWQDATADTSINSVDVLLEDIKDPSATVAEIDAILGDKNFAEK